MIDTRSHRLAALGLFLLVAGCSPDPDSAASPSTDMEAMGGDEAVEASQERGMGGMAGMSMGPGESIRITARQASLAGVSFAVAQRAPVIRTVRAVGMVVPDEARQGIVNTRVDGWIERLLVNETGRRVAVGETLFEIYSPDLVTAQEELLLASRLAGLHDPMPLAARRRLVRWGIADSLVDEIERSGQVRETLPIGSPFGGTVLDKRVVEGQHVRAGETLFEIVDLSTVWIEPAVFEQDIRLVRLGQRAQVTFDAQPGRVYTGIVSFLYPTLDPSTRTLKVRIDIPNPSGDIRPMMYGAVSLEGSEPPGVTVPLTSVLPTGLRHLAFVVRGGRVLPTEVVVGSRGDESVTVLDGIAAGDTVVASAAFLFDSESSLAAAMAGIMLGMGMGLDMGGMETGDMEMDMSPDSSSGPGGMDMTPDSGGARPREGGAPR